MQDMQPKQDQVTRIQAKWLKGISATAHAHITTRFMPMVTGHKTGVEAVRAGLLQLIQITPADGGHLHIVQLAPADDQNDRKIVFRPVFGAN